MAAVLTFVFRMRCEAFLALIEVRLPAPQAAQGLYFAGEVRKRLLRHEVANHCLVEELAIKAHLPVSLVRFWRAMGRLEKVDMDAFFLRFRCRPENGRV